MWTHLHVLAPEIKRLWGWNKVMEEIYFLLMITSRTFQKSPLIPVKPNSFLVFTPFVHLKYNMSVGGALELPVCKFFVTVEQMRCSYVPTIFPFCGKISWLAAGSLFISAVQTRECYQLSHLTLSKTQNSKSPFQSTELLLCDAALGFQVNKNGLGEQNIWYSVQKIYNCLLL